MDRLRNLRQVLRDSLWFLPTIMSLVAVFAAFGLLAWDRALPQEPQSQWLFSGDPDGARAILATIATSVMTLAGVAFSVTVVALALAASQFGSLLLASYLRDRMSQAVLGTFVAAIIYSLMVLGNLGGENGLVPYRAVNASLAFAIATLVAFVIFIHSLSQSLRAERLAASVGSDLIHAVKSTFPAANRGPFATPVFPVEPSAPGWSVTNITTGYVQAIEWDKLVELADADDLLLRIGIKAGDFVTEGTPLGSAIGGTEANRAALARSIATHVLIGHQRTPTQDPEYSVHQLAQVAVRALSPSINDPYTALICIDWLEAALRMLVRRGPTSTLHMDKQHKVRVMSPEVGVELMAAAAFNKLRYAARGNEAILVRLMKAAGYVLQETDNEAERQCFRLHLEKLHEEAQASLLTDTERKEADAVYHELTRSDFA